MNGAVSGGAVSDSSPESPEVLETNSDSAGVFFSAVFVSVAGHFDPCLVCPIPSLGTMSTASAQ